MTLILAWFPLLFLTFIASLGTFGSVKIEVHVGRIVGTSIMAYALWSFAYLINYYILRLVL